MISRKGQSAIEYILLATCVVALLIVFLSPGGKMFNAIDRGVNATADQILVMANRTDFSKGYYCGDGSCCSNPDYCDPIETVNTCCSDCAHCGDGVCSSCESSTNCPSDCGGTLPPTCSSFDDDKTGCCSQSQCIWREYYHLNTVTKSCISKSSAPSLCDSYNVDSCCCVKEAGYSGGGEVPVCAQ